MLLIINSYYCIFGLILVGQKGAGKTRRHNLALFIRCQGDLTNAPERPAFVSGICTTPCPGDQPATNRIDWARWCKKPRGNGQLWFAACGNEPEGKRPPVEITSWFFR